MQSQHWEKYKQSVLNSGKKMVDVTDHFDFTYSRIKQKFHAKSLDAKFIKSAYKFIGIDIDLDEVFK